MKLALLGADPFLAEFAEATAEKGQHQIVCICEAGDWAGDVLQTYPAAKVDQGWEAILVGADVDAVVVGRPERIDAPERIDQLRLLAQQGVPTILLVPAAESIVLYELAMIQSDAQATLTAWNPLVDGELAGQLRNQIGQPASDVGELQEIQLRRTAATTDWLAILGQLAVDVELLLDLAGPINRVTAFSPQQSKGPVRNLLVTMGGETDVVLQWTYQAGEEAAAQLQIHGQGGQRTEELARTPSPGEIAVAIERLLSSKKATDRFLRACRAMEIAEAAGESLRRGRTVQLYEQQRSEQQSFKGIMAAGGCLVLLGVLAMLGASVAIDGLGGGLRENAWWRLWPLCLLTPVVLFLALQVLWRVFPRS